MKYSILLHFIRVYSFCKGYKDLQTKEYNIFENYKLTPLDKICTMDYPKFTVSNQKEESISIQRVKKLAMIHGTIVRRGQRSGINTIKYHTYHRIPHGKVTITHFNTTNESQEVSPFPAIDHKAAMNRSESMTNTRQKPHELSTKEVPPWNGQ